MLLRALVLLALSGWCAGCEQWFRPDGDSRREANYMQGEAWIIERDPARAMTSFERALEVNPRNFNAHERLAELNFDQADYASSYYHFRRYFDQTKDTNYVLVQRFQLCGLRLAQQFADQIGRVQAQGDVDYWRQKFLESSNQVQTVTRQLAQATAALAAVQLRAQTQAVVTPVAQVEPGPQLPPRYEPPRLVAAPLPTNIIATPVSRRATDVDTNRSRTVVDSSLHHESAPVAPQPRKYTIQEGDTPGKIARHFNITLHDFSAVNPGLDARRLRVGMEVNLPPKR
jgi:LysM repeat protein